MSHTIPIAAHYGAGNETSFHITSQSGQSVNLDDLTSVVVTVSVHNPDGADWTISSATSAVNFAGTTVTIKFGLLNLPTGIYYPKVSYVHSTDSEPEVLIGRRYLTEVRLTAYQ